MLNNLLKITQLRKLQIASSVPLFLKPNPSFSYTSPAPSGTVESRTAVLSKRLQLVNSAILTMEFIDTSIKCKVQQVVLEQKLKTEYW